MQYNIFRIKDKDGLFKEMINNNYIKSKVEKQVDDYCLNLYYSKKDSSKISWQNILNEFDVDITVDKDSLKGILLIESAVDFYAVTYGMSSALVQKYCDTDFAMNIAKRVDVSKVKRKAAKFLNGSTSSLVKTMSNSDIIVLDRGESVVNLEIIPDEIEQLGKSITIGKSLKLNLDKSIDNISEILSIIKNIENRNDKRPIPLFVKVTDDELKTRIWDYLNISFMNNIKNANFSLEEMNILGSSIYFDDNFRLQLAYINKKEEISVLNTDVVRNFIDKNNIKTEKILDYIKIKYISDGDASFSRSLKEVVTYDFSFENTNYVIYDGDIYYYNNDFYQNIKDGLELIDFVSYDMSNDKSSKWYEGYLNDNNYVDIKENKESKENRIVTYREKAINDVLSKKYKFDNLDRNLVDINKGRNYKIEIADLGKIDDVIYAVKIGSPRDFCYAIDQSNLTVDAFMSRTYDKDPLIEEYKRVKKIGLWLYIKGKKRIHNDNNKIDILQLDSIMFLNKLVDWANKVVSANYKPVVVINYYE